MQQTDSENTTLIIPRECTLCHTALENPSTAGDYVYGGRVDQKFYNCDSCKVAFLFPTMTEEEEKKFYAQEFEKFMERRAGEDFDWSGPEAHVKSNKKQYHRREKFFRLFVAAGKTVLEVGCSSGFMLMPLKKMGMQVVGVEPSGTFLGFLGSNGINAFSSLEKLRNELKGKKFDLIMHFFVLEHIRFPILFLQELLSFLRPGGMMIFEVPNKSDPLITIYNIDTFKRFYWSVAHHFYYNQASLDYILKRVANNYEIIPEQRYDLSNHLCWALEGKPGGQGKYSSFFTDELETAYLSSMRKTGHCDTLVARVYN